MKLKEIPNLMVDKIYPHDLRLCLPDKETGFNKALSLMSEREIVGNRENLAKKLFKYEYQAEWEFENSPEVKLKCLKKADFILANLGTILECYDTRTKENL